MDIDLDPLTMVTVEGPSSDFGTDTALGELAGNDMFCTGKVRLQMAKEKAKQSGQPVLKHRNGKVDLGAVLDDPFAREFVCPYCSYTFAYKHVLDRHVKQIHEKHKLCNYQCPKCPYNTVRKDQMRSHFSVVHEDFKPYNCSECSFRAPKSFRVTAHIHKYHNGVGVVIHDTNLKPKTVSPPPPEVMQKVRRDLRKEQAEMLKMTSLPVKIGIDALPSPENQQVQLPFPVSMPSSNKLKVVSTSNLGSINGVPAIRLFTKPSSVIQEPAKSILKKPAELKSTLDKRTVIDMPPTAVEKPDKPDNSKLPNRPRILKVVPVKKRKVEEEVNKPAAFYCPHCEDFAAKDQLEMGDHVVSQHLDAHLARNLSAEELNAQQGHEQFKNK